MAINIPLLGKDFFGYGESTTSKENTKTNKDIIDEQKKANKLYINDKIDDKKFKNLSKANRKLFKK